jgi:hypothetical protein
MDGYDVAPVGAGEHDADTRARIRKIQKLAKALNIKID